MNREPGFGSGQHNHHQPPRPSSHNDPRANNHHQGHPHPPSHHRPNPHLHPNLQHRHQQQQHPPHGHHQHHPGNSHHHHGHHPPPPPGHHPPGQGPPPPGGNGVPAKWHSFKMLVDPMIHRGEPKMVRYDGSVVPGNPHHVSPMPCDPRNPMDKFSLWRRLEAMELPVPRFKIDDNYVGEPPKLEVTIENLNDNVNEQFLSNMVGKYGELEEMLIHYHPETGRHLGLARLVFIQVKSARECVKFLHGKSVMGKQLNCYIDPFGASCKQMFLELTTEKPAPPPPPTPAVVKSEPPLPPNMSVPPPPPPMLIDQPPPMGVHPMPPVVTMEPEHDGSGDTSPHHHRDRQGRGGGTGERRRDSRDHWGRDRRDRGRDSRSTSTDSRRDSLSGPSGSGVQPGTEQTDSAYWQKKAQQYASQHETMRQMAQVRHDSSDSQQGDSAVTPSASWHQPVESNDIKVKKEGESLEERLARLADSGGGGILGGGSNSSKNKTEPPASSGGGGAADDHVVDLDTRLKMLMQKSTKGTTGLPSFLAGLGVDEEEAEEELDDKPALQSQTISNAATAPDPLHETPLTRPPSPFLSNEIYHQCFEENRARHKGGGGHGRPISRNSDRMSLSSLSSGDNNILEQGPQQGPPPPTGGPHYPPPGYPGFPPHPGGPPPPHGWPPPMAGYPPGYPPPPGHQMHGGWHHLGPGPYGHHPGGPPPPGGYPGGWGVNQWNGEMDPYSDSYMNDYHGHMSLHPFGKPGPKSVRPIMKETTKRFVNELKAQLAADITKRMCETLAFYLYDEWWQDQEVKYKERNQTKQKMKSPQVKAAAAAASAAPSTTTAEQASGSCISINDKENSSATDNSKLPEVKTEPGLAAMSGMSTTNKIPRIPKVEDISSIFDKQRENMEQGHSRGGAFGKGGSLGLGFRGTIPKLPSFKVQKKEGVDKSKEGKGGERDRRKDKSEKEERRREHEKRREKRLERDKHKDKRRKEEDKGQSRKSDDDDLLSPTRRESKESNDTFKRHSTESKLSADGSKPKTIGDLYNELYYDSSETEERLRNKDSSSTSKPADASKKSPVKSKTTSSLKDKSNKSEKSPVKSEKPAVKKPAGSEESEDKSSSVASSDESSPVTSSDSSSEEASSSEASSVSASGSTSTAASASESESSSSEAESSSVSDDVSAKKKKATPAKKPKARASAEAEKVSVDSSGESSDDEDEIALDIEGTSGKPDATPTSKADKSRADSLPSSYEESPPHIMDHDYARPPATPASSGEPFANDHGGYAKAPAPAKAAKSPEKSAAKAAPPAESLLQQVQEKKRPAFTPSLLTRKPLVPAKKWQPRSAKDEYDVLFRFLTSGLNLEDINYFKASYQMMLDKPEMSKLLNYTHWVDHSVTEIPDPPTKKKKVSQPDYSRKHLTGSCRTEGYYKMDPREKARTKYHLQRDPTYGLGQDKIANLEGAVTKARGQTSQGLSREARNQQRRQLAILGDQALHSDLLSFNQLKFRRKNMTFGKSAIHDWGLFAKEYIGADEMVIEYVGEVVRTLLSDVREGRYEKQGIGSSYLFRIDQEGGVVDATKAGNLARFINHSCDPNCYAKIITIDGEKKIVIYSKQPIACGEEITYDYKFPIEDEKIRCLCGAKSCRKYLN